MYIPKTEFIFPEKTDDQIFKVRYKRKVKINRQYYNRLKTFVFKFVQFFFRILYVLIAFPLVKIRYHLKVEGKKQLKKYKKTLKKDGFITVSNHVFLWDFVALCETMKMGFPKVPMLNELIYSKYGGIFTLAGAVVIPKDRNAFRGFYGFMDETFKQNKWVHIYPEKGIWYYYAPIRPFFRGAAYFACTYNKPIVPIAYSYRERKGIAKIFNDKDPYITVHIGEPVYPDMSLPKREAETKLNKEIRNKMIKMAGFSSEEENDRVAKQNYRYENGHYYTVF